MNAITSIAPHTFHNPAIETLVKALVRLDSAQLRYDAAERGSPRRSWFADQHTAANLDALEAINAAFPDIDGALDELIDAERENAGWVTDELGEWHAPGTDAFAEIARERLADAYGDMRAREAR